MIDLAKNMECIVRTQIEMNKCKTKGPHYRDLMRRMRKLKKERAAELKRIAQEKS